MYDLKRYYSAINVLRLSGIYFRIGLREISCPYSKPWNLGNEFPVNRNSHINGVKLVNSVNTLM